MITMQEISENPNNIPLGFWLWLYDNYEELIAEYKYFGRFLSLQEVKAMQERIENPIVQRFP
jgi:hypothetical protein